MANYIVPTNSIGSAAFALTAGQVSTVTFADDLVTVDVITDGASAVWWTCDGSTPAVDGARSYYVPSMGVDQRQPQTAGGTVVKLVSSGTPTVRVQRGDPRNGGNANPLAR